MIQEDKGLLLKDLCARLPYGVTMNVTEPGEDNVNFNCFLGPDIIKEISSETGHFKYIPYLRPMSSMTKEELEELKSKCTHTETEEDWEGVRSDVWGIQILDKYDTRRWDNPIWPSTINVDAIDWLNKNMFDYRGLIPMGLALEAPEDMYNTDAN